jgi:hypothetical protein
LQSDQENRPEIGNKCGLSPGLAQKSGGGMFPPPPKTQSGPPSPRAARREAVAAQKTPRQNLAKVKLHRRKKVLDNLHNFAVFMLVLAGASKPC